MSKLTDRDLEMAQEIGKTAGQHVVARIVELADNDEFIARVTHKWTGEAQRIVGAAVIKFVFWVTGIVMLIAAWKAGLVQAITDAVGANK